MNFFSSTPLYHPTTAWADLYIFVDRIFSIMQRRRRRGGQGGCGCSPFSRQHYQFSVCQGVGEPVVSKDRREIVLHRIFDVSRLSPSWSPFPHTLSSLSVRVQLAKLLYVMRIWRYHQRNYMKDFLPNIYICFINMHDHQINGYKHHPQVDKVC